MRKSGSWWTMQLRRDGQHFLLKCPTNHFPLQFINKMSHKQATISPSPIRRAKIFQPLSRAKKLRARAVKKIRYARTPLVTFAFILQNQMLRKLLTISTVESFIALVTTISTLSAVNQAVLIKYRTSQESFAANKTVVGSLALKFQLNLSAPTLTTKLRCIYRMAFSDVIVQIGSNRKLPVTIRFGAHERLDA